MSFVSVAVADAAGSIAKSARPRLDFNPGDAVGTPRRAIGIARGDAAIAAVAAESDMGGTELRVENAGPVSRCRARWCAWGTERGLRVVARFEEVDRPTG